MDRSNCGRNVLWYIGSGLTSVDAGSFEHCQAVTRPLKFGLLCAFLRWGKPVAPYHIPYTWGKGPKHLLPAHSSITYVLYTSEYKEYTISLAGKAPLLVI